MHFHLCRVFFINLHRIYCIYRMERKEVKETFFKQLSEVSCSQALDLMVGLSHRGICWKGHAAGHKQSSRCLEVPDENFLTQVVEKLMSGQTLLNLMLRSKETVLQNVKFSRNLDDTDSVMVKVKIMKGGNKAKSRIPAPDFSRTDFGLFRDQVLVLSSLKILKARDSLSATLPVNVFSPLPLSYLLSFHGAAVGSS